jgi:hypothetical protein
MEEYTGRLRTLRPFFVDNSSFIVLRGSESAAMAKGVFKSSSRASSTA